MSEEKEKAKTDKKKVIISSPLIGIQAALNNAASTASYVDNVIKKNQELFEAVKRMTTSFNFDAIKNSVLGLSQAYNQIQGVQTSLNAFAKLASPNLEALRQLNENALRLSTQFSEIRGAIQSSLSPSEIVTKIELIPAVSQQTVKALEYYITVLIKELKKTKQENKELLKLLDESKKELKKQYIA